MPRVLDCAGNWKQISGLIMHARCYRVSQCYSVYLGSSLVSEPRVGYSGSDTNVEFILTWPVLEPVCGWLFDVHVECTVVEYIESCGSCYGLLLLLPLLLATVPLRTMSVGLVGSASPRFLWLPEFLRWHVLHRPLMFQMLMLAGGSSSHSVWSYQ